MLHAVNRTLWNAITSWEGNLRLNQPQFQPIESCLEYLVNFIQGLPGTGKSEVATDTVVLVAPLGKNVLIASPTNGAGKANATKLAKTMRSVPALMKQQFHPVYLPTHKESIEQIYEHRGYATRPDRQDSDNVFDDFQLRQRVVTFAKPKDLAPQKQKVADGFLTAFSRLNTAKTKVGENELEEFRKDFKLLTNSYLRQEDLPLIVITTCNNSYMLKKLDFKCWLLSLDEAALAAEYGFSVPLAVQHDALAQLGDHLQVDPTVMSQYLNPTYDRLKVSNFKRSVTDATVDSIMLRIVYCFGQTIADIVGIFDGYNGPASGAKGHRTLRFLPKVHARKP
ncbi:hypothetical protein BDZ45DRAFT_75275 [Acephala macrosclerotiorum]|nr:hypothetical protein BDZ45DRAFT_75275 [Acephala macrosclerotiorum]